MGFFDDISKKASETYKNTAEKTNKIISFNIPSLSYTKKYYQFKDGITAVPP